MAKMLRRLLLISILIITIVSTSVIFTACSDSLEKKLTNHEWVTSELDDPITYTFFDNGTYKMVRSWSYGGIRDSENGTWEIDGTNLVLSQKTEPYTFKQINEGVDSSDSFERTEWYVSDKYFYLGSIEYVGVN